ncbi:MAG: 50S ribosomal protein L9 [Armatimonadetes bacterium]|nr:50S ribosomal protein L9 [Armatimonadota bacterium]
MQVILLQDVERLGHEGDVLNVADGYGRNYLLPRGLAVKADKGTLKELEMRRSAIARRDADKRSAAQKAASELQGKLITVRAVTGQGTRLHGTVTTAQIAEAASEQLGITIDRRDIDIPEPIREVGDYLISVRLYKDVAAQLPVHVVPQKQAAEEKSEDLEDEAAAEPDVVDVEAVEADETDELED